MEQGYYPVQGAQVKVNADRVEECSDAFDELVKVIG